jgi:hypothetical protein
MTRRSYIQVNGKLIPKEEYYGDNSRNPQQGYILPDIEPFVSSVDGSVVSSRSVLREHNRKHDVVQYAEFSPEYIEKKVQERMLRLNGQTKEDKQHRIELLKNAIDNQRR